MAYLALEDVLTHNYPRHDIHSLPVIDNHPNGDVNPNRSIHNIRAHPQGVIFFELALLEASPTFRGPNTWSGALWSSGLDPKKKGANRAQRAQSGGLDLKNRSYTSERAEVYYECMEPFKSLMRLWIRNRNIAAIWLEKVVTPLIVPAIKVEFRRISLRGFRSCISRSQTEASQSRQTRYCRECSDCSRTASSSITSQDVDELNPNAMVDGNTFVNPFANTSTSAAVASSSSQNVDPSNMHTFYQPYPHEFQWTKDHPLEQVIGEPSRPVLTRNQLRSDGDMCIYALT
nr:hypothetical protein [Tanacetum cinerariifolium]